MAENMINRRDFSGCLKLLEAQARKVLAGTAMIEDKLLSMLALIRLLHKTDREFAAEISPHEPRIMVIMESVLRAKSLDVEINRSLGKYRSLVDYVSRSRLGHESMLDDPGFWPWLDGAYPNVSRFLRTDGAKIRKTNDFINLLGIKFKSRGKPASGAYMGALDGLCRQVLEICAERACDYPKKAADGFAAARTEMVTLVAINGSFGIGHIDPAIPGSGNLADMTFEHGGIEHYVEVYSYADYDMAGTEIREDILPEAEWEARFKKVQIKSLREAGVHTVYVMNLNDFQAQWGETGSREFREAASRMMPKNSDIVVILHGSIEVASLRDGRVTEEPSALVVRLADAIRKAMPENAPGVRTWP